MNTARKIASLLFTLILLSNQSIAQRLLITKDSAIAIALKHGLKKGLAEYDATLLRDTIWDVISLVCDDESVSLFDAKLINAKTGEEEKNIYCAPGQMYHIDPGGKIERTTINSNLNIDSLPIVIEEYNKKLTPLNESESNPVFSDNDKRIAFQYGFRKIGIINSDGSDFKEICEECLYPQWLDDDWIMYFKDFEHIYKKNIHTNIEFRITKEPYGYDNFQLSPNKKWILYQSSEMWPTNDSLGNQTIYLSTNGQGENLCIMSIDGQVKKFFKKEWTYHYNPYWTSNSDSILFYISDQKYIATNLSDSVIDYSKYNLQENLSLTDDKKVLNGFFPFIYHGQVLEIEKKSLTPIRILVNDIGRYRDVWFSHNKDYLIYSKTNKRNGEYSIWIKKMRDNNP